MQSTRDESPMWVPSDRVWGAHRYRDMQGAPFVHISKCLLASAWVSGVQEEVPGAEWTLPVEFTPAS